MQGGPICHPAYYSQPGAEPEPDSFTVYDSRALGNPGGYITTFTRAERVSESRAHTHTGPFGEPFTHEHANAGAVHAHSHPTGDFYRVKENHGT